MSSDTDGAREFERHRPRLVALAYRMLGSASEAEDTVQDAYLRWHGASREDVESPAAWLTTVVTNLCRNRLTSARAQRERYPGPWLPEPVATGPGVGHPLGPLETAEQRESVSLGLLALMERLTPSERAVFVLHEAFGFPYGEVAGMLGRTEHAVRQLAYRARNHVRERRGQGRSRTATGDHRQVVRRFMDAALGGDLAALLDVLAPGVTLWADANGLSEMPRQPLRGAGEVAAYLVSVAGFWPAGLEVRELPINHGPGVLVLAGGAPFLAFAFEPDGDGRLAAIHAVRNPDKLTGLDGPTVGRDQLR